MNTPESITMFIVMFAIVVLPLLIFAIVLLSGRGGFLVSGYNTMSKEKKALYDEKALSKSVGKLLLALLICMVLIPVAIHMKATWLMWCLIALFFVLVIGYVIYANTGKRFLKEKTMEPSAVAGMTTRATKAGIIIAVVVTVVVLAVIGAMMSVGVREPEVKILGDGIQIKAMYGRTVEFSEIASISLIEKSMGEIGPGRRTNGYGGIGQALKGNFSSSSLGEILLFVQSNSSPTIWIERMNERDIYISFREKEETRALYRDLTDGFDGW